MKILPPLSLYIHMPWCIKKCPYCDFNSHTLRGELLEADYIAALLNDLNQHHQAHGHRIIDSIFIGGGTPSLFSASSYQRLFDGIKNSWQFADDIEITLEANPSSVEANRFKTYREIGINRLSLGVQSFDDESLKNLGRVHDSNTAKKAIDAIKKADFANFNIDIMHGLPNQRVENALRDLKTALSFAPTHLSWYQLTIEPNTYFYRHKPNLPSDEALAEIEDSGKVLLAPTLSQYEISAFSRRSRQAKHNLNYWRFGDYLGIGAGAHGKLTEDGVIYRTQKKRVPKDYLSSQQAKVTTIDSDTAAFEFMLNHTRLKEPMLKSNFKARTFLSLETIRAPLDKAIAMGLMAENPKILQVTELGYRFLNDLQGLFLAELT